MLREMLYLIIISILILLILLLIFTRHNTKFVISEMVDNSNNVEPSTLDIEVLVRSDILPTIVQHYETDNTITFTVYDTIEEYSQHLQDTTADLIVGCVDNQELEAWDQYASNIPLVNINATSLPSLNHPENLYRYLLNDSRYLQLIINRIIETHEDPIIDDMIGFIVPEGERYSYKDIYDSMNVEPIIKSVNSVSSAADALNQLSNLNYIMFTVHDYVDSLFQFKIPDSQHLLDNLIIIPEGGYEFRVPSTVQINNTRYSVVGSSMEPIYPLQHHIVSENVHHDQWISIAYNEVLSQVAPLVQIENLSSELGMIYSDNIRIGDQEFDVGYERINATILLSQYRDDAFGLGESGFRIAAYDTIRLYTDMDSMHSISEVKLSNISSAEGSYIEYIGPYGEGFSIPSIEVADASVPVYGYITTTDVQD